MTPEQAIRILSSETSLVAVEELKYYAGFNNDKVIEQIEEAMNMGAAALQKRAPKKPIHVKRPKPQMHLGQYNCPDCNTILLWDDEVPRTDDRKGLKPAIDNYCSVCGQKIDWKGINEE